VKHERTVIAQSAMEVHLRDHAYKKITGTQQYIGAHCDCPRVTQKQPAGVCQACKGTGKKVKTFRVPQAGDKVKVIDPDLLTAIFGAGEEPDEPGIVFDAQTPDEHHLELRSGLGIRVTWDRLTKTGTIPKGQNIDLWTFDLLELEIVK
jgi:hypothetical protein